MQAEKRAEGPAPRARPTAYAAVPAFTEDMPIQDEPGAEPTPSRRGDRRRAGGQPAAAARPRPPAAAGSRRRRAATVRPSGASGRQQPTRQPRSKRGKK